jgi:hypothetical protein
MDAPQYTKPRKNSSLSTIPICVIKKAHRLEGDLFQDHQAAFPHSDTFQELSDAVLQQSGDILDVLQCEASFFTQLGRRKWPWKRGTSP